MKMGGNETLQVNGLASLGHGEQDYVLRTGCRIQHTVEHRLQENQPKGFQETNPSQQEHAGQQLHEKRKDVADEAHQLPHGTPARCRPQSLAAGGIGMRCKVLFYLSYAPEK